MLCLSKDKRRFIETKGFYINTVDFLTAAVQLHLDLSDLELYEKRWHSVFTNEDVLMEVFDTENEAMVKLRCVYEMMVSGADHYEF